MGEYRAHKALDWPESYFFDLIRAFLLLLPLYYCSRISISPNPVIMKKYCLSILSFFFAAAIMAQCDFTTLTIEITTDFYPYENSWKVAELDGTVIATLDLGAENVSTLTTVSWDVCLPLDACVIFTIYDDYGDGIEFGGGYKLYVDDTLILDEELTGYEESLTVNCGAGQSCLSADQIVLGEYLTSFDDHWYVFVPEENGQYLITTCDLTVCDTKIWVYDNCVGHEGVEDNAGTFDFDDNFGGCGEQANLTIDLAAGEMYYLRIGDDSNTCLEDIPWSLSYLGLIEGCTDPTACNYNPAAGVDDGSCIPHGDPACPQAPDLFLNQEVLRSSIYLTTIANNDACLIEEGCLSGFGQRDIIRFSTYIANIGELDYYIGEPNDDANQFTYDNCHGHWHYDGYAEYLLFDESGQEIPIGFKNGFCVIDLGCTTGQFQYQCNNMGISAGCYDEYWAELECQWIDITDVPDGDYTFVTRVNWDNAPDALGRVEKDSLNNWGQVCININRTSGQIAFEVLDDCPTYIDCEGTLYGSAQFDCAGNCGGTALQGDLNADENQDFLDVQMYAEGLLTGEIPNTACNDISANGSVDILDLALLSDCINFGSTHVHQTTGPHDHCTFGLDITSSDEAAELIIAAIDPVNSFVDVHIQNPDSRVVAYQFSMSGINMTTVESITDPIAFTAQPMMEPLSNQVMAYVTDSTFLERQPTYQPLVRIYFEQITDGNICIETITAVVNELVHRVPTTVGADACVSISATEQALLPNLSLFPNPTQGELTIHWTGTEQIDSYEILDISGKLMDKDAVAVQNQFQLNVEALPAGIYWLRLVSEESRQTLKFIRH